MKKSNAFALSAVGNLFYPMMLLASSLVFIFFVPEKKMS